MTNVLEEQKVVGQRGEKPRRRSWKERILWGLSRHRQTQALSLVGAGQRRDRSDSGFYGITSAAMVRTRLLGEGAVEGRPVRRLLQ